MSNDSQLVKIEIRGEDNQVETVWAFDLGNHLYKLDNTPWFAYRISTGDIIEAEREEADGFPVFKRVVEKSGYRTVRIVADQDFDDEFFEQINSLGCSFEGATRRYVAIDVPPPIDLDAIANFLNEKNIRWEHADPTYEDLHGPGAESPPESPIQFRDR